MVTLIGVAAGVLTTGCLVPQVVKTRRTRSTGDLSLLYLVALDLGLCLWIVYGLCVWSLPIIVSNIISATLVGYLVFAKVRQRSAARSRATSRADREAE